METVNQSRDYGESEDIKSLEIKIKEEIQKDNVLPEDDLEIQKITRLNEWLLNGNADFQKMKIRFYAKNYRGVHARRNIKVTL